VTVAEKDNQNLEVAAAAERQTGLILAVVLAIAACQYFVLPLVVPIHAGVAIGLVVLCAVSTPLHWGLMHESIHGHLFADQRANRLSGRILGYFLFLSWDVMRFGHLLHHSANRHVFDRPEAIPPGSTRVKAAMPYFLKLLGGHALTSALAPLMILLPFSAQKRLVESVASGDDGVPFRVAVLRALADPARRARIRMDVLMNVVLVAIAVWCWGPHWIVFVASLGARFCILSLLDNAPHYATPIDSGTRARNSWLPRSASWAVLDHNFHGVHHASPGLRWQELRAAFERSGAEYEGTWTTTVLRQFQGPVALDQTR
jgi:fatty acid desaturase